MDIGCWLWFHLCLDEGDKAPEQIPPNKLILACVQEVAKATPNATEKSRRKRLKEKFKNNYSRIMKIVEEQAFDEATEARGDLEMIGEIFKRREIGFDLKAAALKNTIALKE